MKASDYVRMRRAIADLESGAYEQFNELWRKLSANIKDDKSSPLTEQEYDNMEYFMRAMQDLGYIRGVLEKYESKGDEDDD